MKLPSVQRQNNRKIVPYDYYQPSCKALHITSYFSRVLKADGIATLSLILTCVLVYGVIRFTDLQFYKYFVFLSPYPLWLYGIPWITSQFIHMDLPHLFGNMFVLFICGYPLERAFGKKWIINLFLLGGIAAKVSELLFSVEDFKSFGASGGVVVIMIAYLLYFPRLTFFPSEISQLRKREGIPSYILILYFIVPAILNAINGYYADNVSHLGHLGGAVVGYLAWVFFNIENTNSNTSMNRFLYWISIEKVFPLCAIIIAIWLKGKPLNIKVSYGEGVAVRESGPQYEHLVHLREVILRNDERRLKMYVNSLMVPLEKRPPGEIPFSGYSEVEGLADKINIPKTDPRFLHFLDLYKYAIRFSIQYPTESD